MAKKVKKILMSVLIGLLVLIVVIAVVFKLFGNKIIRSGIVVGANKALQVPVRLDSIDLKLLAGTVDLQNFEIDNPQGYDDTTFVKLGHAHVDLDVPTLMSDTIEISMIQLEDMKLVIEQKGGTSNIEEILNNLPKSEEQEEPVPQPAEKGPGKNLRIKVLEINNIQVAAELLPLPGRASKVTLPPINLRLENIGNDEKIDMPALVSRILTEITKAIAENGKDLLPLDMVGSLTEDIAEQGKQLLKTGQDASKEILEGAEDVGKSATEAIKGIGDIFKKKDE